MKARFAGTCRACGGVIDPGMEILWEKGAGAAHVMCPNSGEATTPNGYARDVSVDDEQYDIPLFVRARAKYPQHQVRFYESLAVPDPVLTAIVDESAPMGSFASYRQWRIDYLAATGSPVDESIGRVALIAHKILTRGRTTLLSPFLEDRLSDYFKPDRNGIHGFSTEKYLCLCNTLRENDFWVDSPWETKFLQEILREELGPAYRHWVTPQVHLSSLGRSPSDPQEVHGDQRVDFVISLPDRKMVVELDGPDHVGHEQRDDSRDAFLSAWGYLVLRIPNDEIDAGDGPHIRRLREFLRDHRGINGSDLSNADRWIVAVKLAHQVQVVVTEAILCGALDFGQTNTVYFDYTSVAPPHGDMPYVIQVAIEDLCELLRRLASLYTVSMPNDGALRTSAFDAESTASDGVVITYGNRLMASIPCFYVQDIALPVTIAQFGRVMRPQRIANAPREDLEYLLRYLFRKSGFWEGQYEAICRVLAGQDSIVLLPTGGGKSIAFQLASLLLPGVAVVIDPIVALIEDQIDNLRAVGMDRAVAITGMIRDPSIRSELIRAFGQGEYLFCYVAPERFQMREFRDALRSLTLSTPISLVAIDEAHCVSEWGHDFRPSYLNIGRVTRACCACERQIPPLLALTGTASHAVLKDVQRELQIEDFGALITPATFDRRELRYSVYEAPSDQKVYQLQSLLARTLPDRFGISSMSFHQPNGDKTLSGVVFCPFVNGDYGVVKIAEILRQSRIDAVFYAGGAPKGWRDGPDWSRYKRETAKSFKHNRKPLLVATKAFGMGIDKPNIRYTVHFGIPPSIEAFYQEAGRAGRDRGRAECVLLYSVADRRRAERLLRPDASLDVIQQERKAARRDGTDDDITRALFFHGFEGIEAELSDIRTVMAKLGYLDRRRQVTIKLGEMERTPCEKVIHRLVVLGIVEDYTIDYASGEFTVAMAGNGTVEVIEHYERYVSGYNIGRVQEESRKIRLHADRSFDEFVFQACRVLVSFIYDTIEKGRRRALQEMYLMADAAADEQAADGVVRARILRYLQSSHTEQIQGILDETDGFECLKRTVEGEELPEGEIRGGIRSPRDAEEIRGQVARHLESVPDHPGLLFLRALSEAYCGSPSTEVVLESLMSGIQSAVNQYAMDKSVVLENLQWIFRDMAHKKQDICTTLVEELIFALDDPQFARLILSDNHLPEQVLYPAGMYLFSRLSQEAVAAVHHT